MIEQNELRRFERHVDLMLRMAGTDDPEGFAAIVEILDRARRDGLPAAAQQLRTPDATTGARYSWADLAGPLGVTRDAARQRFGRASS